jgi:rod shape-determining protein MreD
MDALKIAVVLVCLVFLQSSVVPAIRIGRTTPDLVICGVVFVALGRGTRSGVVAGFTAGFLSDLYAPPALGTHALACSIVGCLLGVAHRGFYGEGKGTQLLLVLAGATLQGIILFLLAVPGGAGNWTRESPLQIPLNAAYTAVVSLLLFPIFRRAIPASS